MRKIIYMLTLFTILAGCKKDNTAEFGDNVVANLNAIPDYGKILLKYDLSTTEDVFYIKIKYGHDDSYKFTLASVSTDSILFENLDNAEYNFTLITHYKDGRTSDAANIAATPKDPMKAKPLASMSKKMKTPYIMNLTWNMRENITSAEIEYTDDNDVVVNKSIPAPTKLLTIYPNHDGNGKYKPVKVYFKFDDGTQSEVSTLAPSFTGGDLLHTYVDSKIGEYEEYYDEGWGVFATPNTSLYDLTYDEIALKKTFWAQFQIQTFDDMEVFVGMEEIQIGWPTGWNYPPDVAPDVSALARCYSLKTVYIGPYFPLDASHFSGPEFSHLTIVKQSL